MNKFHILQFLRVMRFIQHDKGGSGMTMHGTRASSDEPHENYADHQNEMLDGKGNSMQPGSTYQTMGHCSQRVDNVNTDAIYCNVVNH